MTVSTDGGHLPLRLSLLLLDRNETYYQMKSGHCAELGYKKKKKLALGTTLAII